MELTFVHFSDIHFGQEKGGETIVNDDVRDMVVHDLKNICESMPNRMASGVLVTGDIAYSGKEHEYKAAGEWLDKVTAAIKCDRESVQVVPGNHDIDRDEISPATKNMLSKIADGGEKSLDEYLESDTDRELLYRRFKAYETFADVYRCLLDKEGGNAGDREIEIAPGRKLLFIGLNSALICSKRDEEGRLLLGPRQRVLPVKDGCELIVLSHHPLNWFQDSDDARRYLRNRARMLITGHEHFPSVSLESSGDGNDLLLLAAGATIPPEATDQYRYTYNVINISWIEAVDDLRIEIWPRVWSEERKAFEAGRIGSNEEEVFHLACRNFRRIGTPPREIELGPVSITPKVIMESEEGEVSVQPGARLGMSDRYDSLFIRFFRDLAGSDRAAIFERLKILPVGSKVKLNHAVEKNLFDAIFLQEKDVELEELIKEFEIRRNAKGD